jgi:hypothetical protein
MEDPGRMARGGHGLPKVSLGPAMPYPSTPCGRATCRAGSLQPSSTPLDNGQSPPYAYGSRPASLTCFSRSPCWKNSSARSLATCCCTSQGLVMALTSEAVISIPRKSSFRSPRAHPEWIKSKRIYSKKTCMICESSSELRTIILLPFLIP